MLLGNYNNLTLMLFLLLIFIGISILFLLYKKQKNIFVIFFLFLSFFFLIVNIFELKGGYISGIEKVKGGKIVFVVDVSKSMDVLDIKDINTKKSRLTATKDLIEKYIIKNLNNYYGLMIFAGETMEVLPFTNDVSIFSTILYGINDKNIAKYGTNLNSIFISLENYFLQEDEGGLVVIFTDGGEEHITVNDEKIIELEKKGIKIMIVGIGTKIGGKIPIGNDFFGSILYKTYEGEEIISSLNNKELENISTKYKIEYSQVDNYTDFGKIEEYVTKNINLIDLEKSNNNRIDLTRIFTLISFIFFILFLIADNFKGTRK